MPKLKCESRVMQSYLYLVKLRCLIAVAYRFEVLTWLSVRVILLVSTIFLWKTAYRDVDQVAGVSEEGMITYTIISMLITVLFVVDVQNTVLKKVREGDLAIDLIRPAHPLGQWLAEDIGSALAQAVMMVIPLLILASIFFVIPLPSDLLAAILFLPSCLLSFAILWLLSAIVGLVSFWTMGFGDFVLVKDGLVTILSGSLVPLWFFPVWFQDFSCYLPFQYTYQTPLGIYIGKIPPAQALGAMVIQLLWIGVLGVALQQVWRRAIKRVFIQGG